MLSFLIVLLLLLSFFTVWKCTTDSFSEMSQYIQILCQIKITVYLVRHIKHIIFVSG